MTIRFKWTNRRVVPPLLAQRFVLNARISASEFFFLFLCGRSYRPFKRGPLSCFLWKKKFSISRICPFSAPSHMSLAAPLAVEERNISRKLTICADAQIVNVRPIVKGKFKDIYFQENEVTDFTIAFRRYKGSSTYFDRGICW